MDETVLTAAQAAARLGIKPESLYAYVSRGMIERRKLSRGSGFDPLEIERFARARRASSGAGRGAPEGSPLAVIDTDIALIEDGELYFRGVPARELARNRRYEDVLHWLLTNDWDAPPLPAATDTASALGPILAALPPAATLRDRLQVAVTVLAARDPLRYDLRRESVLRAAPALIAGMVEALSPRRTDGGVAQRLWSALTAREATDEALLALNAALVLLIDHDIAISTLAARAAASAQANVYAVVSSGLGALDSALHGNMSAAVHRMLARVIETGDAERVVGEEIARTGRGIPGFGQVLYREEDPRARTLGELLENVAEAAQACAAAASVVALVRGRTGAHPNIDFALGTLTVATAMRPDAGEAIFAVARTGGWMAHAIAEYELAPLRLRPVGRYVGP